MKNHVGPLQRAQNHLVLPVTAKSSHHRSDLGMRSQPHRKGKGRSWRLWYGLHWHPLVPNSHQKLLQKGKHMHTCICQQVMRPITLLHDSFLSGKDSILNSYSRKKKFIIIHYSTTVENNGPLKCLNMSKNDWKK